jgi:phosphoenolpyruvate carboxykinase (GTP)
VDNINRVEGKNNFRETCIGRIPSEDSLDFNGLNIQKDSYEKLFHLDKQEGIQEISSIREFFQIFGERLPQRLGEELDKMEKRILSM